MRPHHLGACALFFTLITLLFICALNLLLWALEHIVGPYAHLVVSHEQSANLLQRVPDVAPRHYHHPVIVRSPPPVQFVPQPAAHLNLSSFNTKTNPEAQPPSPCVRFVYSAQTAPPLYDSLHHHGH
ncbi:hypothetical protein V9T40_007265 [Parthenolecanium corni]|uniref:Uncharacterized protein n=1 Tax=Parthenolecanium corni TaxID=536013 RepID=A0AAN9TV01_9HEMI